MTFFVASIDLNTGELTYANASHEPTLLFRKGANGMATKKSILPLDDVVDKRLGESFHTEYSEQRVQLEIGDTLLFYTDGVMGLTNKKGEEWGERKLVGSVLKSINQNASPDAIVKDIKNEIHVYRSGEKITDDVTFFLCQYEGRSKEEAAA